MMKWLIIGGSVLGAYVIYRLANSAADSFAPAPAEFPGVGQDAFAMPPVLEPIPVAKIQYQGKNVNACPVGTTPPSHCSYKWEQTPGGGWLDIGTGNRCKTIPKNKKLLCQRV